MTRALLLPAVLSACVIACSGLDGNRFTGASSAGAAPTASVDPVATASALSDASTPPEASAASDSGAGGEVNTVQPAAGGAGVMPPDSGASGPPHCVAESCNGKDDDCDQIIDEGCPLGFLPGSTQERKAVGDSPGGSGFGDDCAEDELLVGVAVTFGGWLEQASAVCQRYSLRIETGKGPRGYTVALGSQRSLPPHPSSNGTPKQLLVCQDGAVMVGLRVWQQHNMPAQPNDNIVLTRLAISCAKPQFNLDPTNPRLEWEKASEVVPASGTFLNETAWVSADSAERTEFPSGLHGAAGAWVDKLGLRVRPIAVLQIPTN